MEKAPSVLSLPRVDTRTSFSWGRNPNAGEGVSAKDTNGVTPVEDTPAPTTLLDWFLQRVTFFRLHLAAFTFIPLISSGVFYACNGQYKISYLDSVFLCYSSMTVTGLSTINLSTLTAWQQVMLYILMTIGDITTVSWVMVLIRKRFFRTKCEYTESLRQRHRHFPHRSRTLFLKSISSPVNAFRQRQPVPEGEKSTEAAANAKSPGTESTKRKNANNLVINLTTPSPSGTLMEQIPRPFQRRPPPSAIPEAHEEEEQPAVLVSSPLGDDSSLNFVSHSPTHDPNLDPTPELPEPNIRDYGLTSPNGDFGVSSGTDFGVASMTSPKSVHYNPMMDFKDGRAVPRRGATMLTHRQKDPLSPSSAHHQGLGGYPGPLDLIHLVAKRAAPRTYTKLERKFTITSAREIDDKTTPWLSFSGLITGRNSDFRIETLSDEQVEELGGTEYRALRLLSYLIPAYFILTQAISFALFAPWLSTTSQYDGLFADQPREIKKPWFALFQVMGAYTGGGLSLVDLGMVPFQNAYLMIFALMFSILAGNHAMPIFLRFIIWILSRATEEGSGMEKALSFLLDHPRRCFLYLFPSHQTWFLLLALVGFSIVEWGAFLILNIGLPAYEAIPAGIRVLAGLFQGLAARASGFAIVPLASFAPALQFMYVVMMYIAIYPIALSIRSTNVYEERSLGVFEAPPDDEDEEPSDLQKLERTERVGKYVGWHLRRQMSIDIWWLVWGVLLVMIIERGNLMDDEKKWFDPFRVLFELVSAFGGIGLTLGIPTENYSFVGAMKPLSKLVVIVIMVRGRHRGLPVAIDRAVQLPKEMMTQQRKPTIDTTTQKSPVNGATNNPV
ncbi:potassium transporter [Coprinopsis sp. MPI-PUGE-AT-0042]|nr:potassium transporter [Coprinopsis sp. MPI-PUGE-AT-0042]